jgi:aspartyl aminopeptidase
VLRIAALVGVGLTACGAPSGPARSGESAAAPKHDDEPSDPLFPARQVGWAEVDAAGRARAAKLAAEYRDFLSAAKTPRRAVASLVALAKAAGATELAAGQDGQPGTLYYAVGPGGDAAVFVRAGSQPIARGMRIVVAGIDAPRIDLKQTPVFDKANLAMLDTFVYGEIDAKRWLVTPLALYVHRGRPGAVVDFSIGEAEGEPVFSIPDLLPHLSSKVQAEQVVDSFERLDAVGAGTRAAWTQLLAERGIDDGMLAEVEAYLVPAGPAVLAGVDGAMISGYGHRHRALAWGAVRALLDEAAPEQTAVVIALSKLEIGGTGSSGLGFATTAISRAIEALAGPELDVLDVRRAYARSAMLASDGAPGEVNHGVAIDARADDAMPDATRRAIDRFTAGGAQHQLLFDGSGDSAANELAELDIDAVGVSVPTQGEPGPIELLSALDLYSGYLACRAWMVRP